MTERTNDYKMFRFRDDNRAEINKTHVERLKKSIAARNMLEFRPIDVNDKMEILDGQHRLLAAQALGTDIYYRIIHDSNPADIILMNVAKTWQSLDYLNYYCKNGYPEYLKFNEFMRKACLSVKVALSLCIGTSKTAYAQFRDGTMKYVDENLEHYLEICHNTIEFIKKHNGSCYFTESTRFWRPLVRLVRDPNFRLDKWEKNLSKLVQRVVAKAAERDFAELFQSVHNYHNQEKVDVLMDYGDR